MEDSLVISLQVIGSLFICVVVVSCIIMWLHRNELIVKSTILPVNTALSVGYIVCTITPIFTTAGSIPCIPYLYLGALNEILLASAYIALAWYMIAMVAVTRRRILEAAIMAQEEDGDKITPLETATPEESSLRMRRIKAKVDEEISNRKFSWIDNWMARRDWTAKTQTALKVYFVVLGGFLILPILVNVIDPTYHRVDTQCSDRTTIEIGELSIIIVTCLVSLTYILAKIWKLKSPFGEKHRLVGMILSWVVLLILLFATGTVNGLWISTLYKILSIGGPIELWTVGNVPTLVAIVKMRIRGETGTGSSARTSDIDLETKPITMQEVIYYDYKDDDPVLMFAGTLDDSRDQQQGFYTYTIMALRQWKAKSERTGTLLTLVSTAYMQYSESIKPEARYKMIVSEELCDKMSEVVKKYEALSESEGLDDARCDTVMNEIVVEALAMLEKQFFKGYVTTKFYREFISKLAVHETIIRGLGKSDSSY